MSGPGRDILEQVTWLDQYVRTAGIQRRLSRGQVSTAQRELRAIRSSERNMRHDRRGELSVRDQTSLQLRLDRLSDRLRIPAR